MASTKFYFDQRRAKDGKPSVLKLAIGHGNKTSYISLDAKLLPSQWDETTSRIKNHPEKMILNAYINEMKAKVDAHIISLTRDGVIKSMSAIDIRDCILEELDPEKRKAKEDKNTFLYRFNKYAKRVSPGTKKTFDQTLNRLIAYSTEKKFDLKALKFEEITIDWLTDFDAFMAKTAPSKNSRNLYFRNIRTVFNDAIEDGITSWYPFRRFKLKNVVTANRDLTVEELRQLIFFDCEEYAVKYRDYFMLMFYLMGINCVDFCHLKETNKGRIEFNRQKTKHFFSMKIEPEAQELLDKYKGENWLIDVLDKWTDYLFFLKKMNTCLHKIGPVTRSGLGGKKTIKPLFPKLTSYYARHTWASIAASLDIPFETISAALGHEYGNKITNIYIHYDNRKVDIANRKVIDWVLYGIRDGEVVVKPGSPEFFGLDRKEAVALGLVKDLPKEEKEVVAEPEKKKRGRPRKKDAA